MKLQEDRSLFGLSAKLKKLETSVKNRDVCPDSKDERKENCAIHLTRQDCIAKMDDAFAGDGSGRSIFRLDFSLPLMLSLPDCRFGQLLCWYFSSIHGRDKK